MARITLEQVAPLLKERRGNRGLRAVAAEIGVSLATLSRVEAGKQPDLETFSKICQWLGLDAGEVLGCRLPKAGRLSDPFAGSGRLAHFKADRTLSPKTAHHLGELILAISRAQARSSVK